MKYLARRSGAYTWHRRSAFTMIEVVSSMAAASLLLAGLATAMHVTNRVLEDAATVNSRSEMIETVADRIAEDARYAISITQTAQRISLTLPDRDGDGADESVVYESSMAGFTRSQSPNPSVALLSTAPTTTLRVDGYTSPTVLATPEPVRLLGWTQAATSSRSWNLAIDMPSGTRPGDLLVMVTAGDSSYIAPFSGGWTPVQFYDDGDLYLAVFTRTATSSDGASQTIYSFGFGYSSIAAAIHCFSGAGLAGLEGGIRRRSGYAKPVSGADMPRPLEQSTVPDHAMNLQVVALEDDPLAAASSGLAGFSDAAVVVAKHNGSGRLTLVTAIRQGKFSSPVPSTLGLSHPARWLQIGTQWWP